MSVIAKMNVFNIRAFAHGPCAELQCVYDADLAHKDNENYRFTQASPSGSARVDNSQGFNIGEEVYLIFTRGEAPENFGGAFAAASLRVNSVTDYGGTSRKVEICSGYRKAEEIPAGIRVDTMNLQMSIDNPAASMQFEAGATDYWVRFYRCSDFTMSQALEFAHGGPSGGAAPAEAEAEREVEAVD